MWDPTNENEWEWNAELYPQDSVTIVEEGGRYGPPVLHYNELPESDAPLDGERGSTVSIAAADSFRLYQLSQSTTPLHKKGYYFKTC